MSYAQVWNNLVAYSLQIGLLIGLCAFLPALFRLRLPHARLVFWQLLLVTCLALPWLRPWRQQVIEGTVDVATVVTRVQAASAKGLTLPPGETLLLLLLAGGVVARFLWLMAGFWRLRRYRRHGRAFGRRGTAQLLLCDRINSPVTFGLRRPVILLPERFCDLNESMQEAILCHESLHVERRDWVFTVAEELIRALFWFHPAIWWLLAEIQLSREQSVDRRVIELTQSRDPYVDALLTMAGAHPQLDLAPAPLFLRKRHLKQRVLGILKEVRMSKTRWISALAGGLGVMALACWFITGAIPLAAEPQVVADNPGVVVSTNGASMMHRSPVVYPMEALAKGIQGTVVVQVKVDEAGNVADASIVSGPDELRKAALGSVLNWHFGHDAVSSTRLVNIDFKLPQGGVQQLSAASVPATPAVSAAARQASATPRVLKSVDVIGLSDQARQELLARLPARVGDTTSPEIVARVLAAMKEFDSHLAMGISPNADGTASLRIAALGGNLGGNFAATAALAPVEVPKMEPMRDANGQIKALRVGGNVQSAKLKFGPKPAYPPEAKAAHISGTVSLDALIAADGTIKELQVVSGEPLLVKASMDAVKQWVYETTLLNGQPVEVNTRIDVNYTLSQ